MRIRYYHVIKERNLATFEKKVADFMNGSWSLHGGPFYARGKYHQAIVCEEGSGEIGYPMSSAIMDTRQGGRL